MVFKRKLKSFQLVDLPTRAYEDQGYYIDLKVCLTLSSCFICDIFHDDCEVDASAMKESIFNILGSIVLGVLLCIVSASISEG